MSTFLSQLDSLIQIVDIKSHTEWNTVQIQISWQKPTDLDLHFWKDRIYQVQQVNGQDYKALDKVLFSK